MRVRTDKDTPGVESFVRVEGKRGVIDDIEQLAEMVDTHGAEILHIVTGIATEDLEQIGRCAALVEYESPVPLNFPIEYDLDDSGIPVYSDDGSNPSRPFDEANQRFN